MSLRLSPYPNTKTSGVEWLGQIPAHWQVKRAKNVFRPIDVRSQTGNEELLTVSSKDGVVPRRTKSVTMFMAASYVGHKLCWPGDLVVNSLWAWANGLGFSQHHGIISSAYGVYRPLPQYGAHFAYFNYLLRSGVYDWEFNVRSKGIWISRLQLTDDEFFKMPVVLTPADEQAAIVRFLDGVDRRVNRLLRDKRRLIALLNEQKQAVIQQAVTKGLNPDAPMKPSGVDWLGDIPAHWDVMKLKHFGRMKSGEGITSFQIADEGAYPVYGGNGLRGYTETFTHDGDFILIGRQGALCGNINYASGQFWASEHAVVVMPLRKFERIYFGELLRTMNLNQYSFAAAQPGLAVERIQNLATVAPPFEEQQSIAAFIEKETAVIDKAISRAKAENELIREYRTRLVSDVVTGKLDVRNAVLPDAFPGAGDTAEEPLDSDETDADIEDDTGGDAGDKINDDADE